MRLLLCGFDVNHIVGILVVTYLVSPQNFTISQHFADLLGRLLLLEMVRFLVYRFRVHESLAKIVKTLTLVYPSTRNWIHDCDFWPIMKSAYESLVRVWAAKLELQN